MVCDVVYKVIILNLIRFSSYIPLFCGFLISKQLSFVFICQKGDCAVILTWFIYSAEFIGYNHLVVNSMDHKEQYLWFLLNFKDIYTLKDHMIYSNINYGIFKYYQCS